MESYKDNVDRKPQDTRQEIDAVVTPLSKTDTFTIQSLYRCADLEIKQLRYNMLISELWTESAQLSSSAFSLYGKIN